MTSQTRVLGGRTFVTDGTDRKPEFSWGLLLLLLFSEENSFVFILPPSCWLRNGCVDVDHGLVGLETGRLGF
jgi:hypothetical protein